MKKISSLLLRISITVALLIFLFAKTDVRSMREILKNSDWLQLFVTFSFFFFLNVLCLWRWHLLLEGSGIHLPFGRLFLSYFSSQFFNLIFPSTIGGDAVRTLDIAKHTQRHSSGILATVLLDRVSGFFGLMTVLLFAIFFGSHLLNDTTVFLSTFIFSFIIVFLVAVMFSKRISRMIFGLLPFEKLKAYLIKIHLATSSYKHKKKILFETWVLSVIIQGGGAIIFYMVAMALNCAKPLIYFLITVPVISAFAVIPISIGGLGVRDAACVFLLGKFGLPAEKALAISLCNFGFMFVLGVGGALCYVFALYRRRL